MVFYQSASALFDQDEKNASLSVFRSLRVDRNSKTPYSDATQVSPSTIPNNAFVQYFFPFSDKEAQPESHKTSYERVYGFRSHRAKENYSIPAGYSQCRSFKSSWQTLEGVGQCRQRALRPGSRTIEATSPQRVSRIQVQAEKEASKVDDFIADDNNSVTANIDSNRSRRNFNRDSDGKKSSKDK